MKTFVLACFLVASASAAFIPAQQQQRHRRDVSELVEQPAYSYLPPAEVVAVETSTATVAELSTEAPSAALGDAGYEYRTVRRLKYRYRTARDVSHLAQHYLPPSNEYLPPADSLENNDTEPDTEEVLSAAPKVANEYLPPNVAAEHEEGEEELKEAAPSTEAALIEAADDSEAPLAAVRAADEQTEPEAAAPIDVDPAVEEEMPQDTAVLADDGYHYKQPVEEALLKSAAPGEYLPPLEEHVVEAVGPAESAVLADDGYHYRAIKRFRF